MTTRLELYELFERHRRTGIACEVGVHEGHNAKNILDRYHGRLVLVDLWPDAEVYDRCREYLSEYLDRCIFIKGESTRIARMFSDGCFDFVYIDAGHSYDEIKKDYESWESKCRIISGHDYSSVFPGVVRFIDELHHVQLTDGDEWEGVKYESWWRVNPKL